MEERKREIKEAIEAGNLALQALSQVEGSIQQARGFGIWDMLGGGLISGLLKHSRMDEADRNMEIARQQLERFQRELEDISASYNLVVKFDGFTRFADYFFDNILVDFLVQERIVETAEQVKKIKIEVQNTLERLYRMENEV